MEGEGDRIYEQSSATKLFYQEWRKMYMIVNIVSSKFGRADPFDFRPFAQRAGFAKREIGPFVLVKNASYNHKRPTDCLQRAEESRCISAPFDQNAFNLNKIKSCQVLFAFGFEEMRLSVLNRQENPLELYKHFIIISGAPVCEGHALFVPFLQENHPQILSRKLVTSSIQAYELFPQFKFSFNSQGAGSSVNHFHIQIIDPRQLLASSQFAFQANKGEEMKAESLLGLGIRVQHFTWMSACYLRFRSSSTIFKQERQLTGLMMTIIDLLLQRSIPHNLIIVDEQTVYLILRGFATLQVKFGWLEYCGVMVGEQPSNDEAILSKFQKIELQATPFLLPLIHDIVATFKPET